MKKVILLLVLFFNIVPCVKNGEVTFGTSQLYAQQGGCRWHKPILGNSGGNSGGTTIGNIIRSIVTFFQSSGGGNEAFGSENPDIRVNGHLWR